MTPQQFIESQNLPWDQQKWDEGGYGAFRNKYVADLIRDYAKGKDILEEKTMNKAIDIAKKFGLDVFKISVRIRNWKNGLENQLWVAFEPTFEGGNWY